MKLPDMLRKEGTGADYLVLWLDCDKEGENICFEVLDALRNTMRLNFSPHNQSVFRARFSAITSEEIRKAFANLVLPNKNEALSVDARCVQTFTKPKMNEIKCLKFL